MTGVEERVNGFLATWQGRQAGEISSLEDAKCTGLGVVLEDGNFAPIEGDMVCLNCMKGLQEK